MLSGKQLVKIKVLSCFYCREQMHTLQILRVMRPPAHTPVTHTKSTPTDLRENARTQQRDLLILKSALF